MFRIRFSIFLSVFVAMVGLMIIAPVMPPLIRELGLNEIHSGIIISLGSIAMAVMAPVWGRLSDRRGRKAVIVIGFIGMFVSYVLFTATMYAGLSQLIGGGLLVLLLIMARGLIGMFIPAVPSAAQAYMADVTDEKGRAAGMALIGAANGMGLVLGPAIAGAFALIGLIWPLYIGALLPIVALLVVSFLIPAHKPVIQEKLPKVNPFQKGLTLYLFAGLATMVSIVTLQVVGGFYFQDQLSLTTKETARMISVGLMITGVAMIVTQGLQMRNPKWQPKPLILIGSLLVIISLALFLFFMNLIVYYVAFFLFGIGTGFMMPGFMAGSSLAVGREQQGGVAGLVASVQGISAVIAPILSTSLYQLEKHLPFAVVGVLVILMGMTLLFSNKEKGFTTQRHL
ncbi:MULTISPECIES: MFS transporter [Brevibacillus]|uniref:MFS transporter n=1 Tax=Brevibacillus TaxID=55080 RepID=UPI000D0F9C63|nr:MULTISPECIES: MFS transporter [Brevibacillus]PSJ68246.1 MFS transporter [Brevibacillus brevis]RED35758.1 putative MFS family arabinose efflux permease [Brevibacillus brevis]TQK53440.1 putative MFS family arabinose efflux permease [Brevibacillus sp. AG162]VEF89132.1 Metal-tetracycline/H(+) antiporter [Brevibacillus brevis]GEC89300.1 MFS transporter [Brevibacillus brevis]